MPAAKIRSFALPGALALSHLIAVCLLAWIVMLENDWARQNSRPPEGQMFWNLFVFVDFPLSTVAMFLYQAMIWDTALETPASWPLLIALMGTIQWIINGEIIRRITSRSEQSQLSGSGIVHNVLIWFMIGSLSPLPVQLVLATSEANQFGLPNLSDVLMDVVKYSIINSYPFVLLVILFPVQAVLRSSSFCLGVGTTYVCVGIIGTASPHDSSQERVWRVFICSLAPLLSSVVVGVASSLGSYLNHSSRARTEKLLGTDES